MRLRSKAVNGVLGLALTVMAGLSACVDPPFYHENRRFDPPEWEAANQLVFTFEIDNTEQPYDFLLHLRHAESYPYSNLYLFLQLDFPNGKKSVDTLECILADPSGQWRGNRTGQLVDHRIVMNQRRIFPLKGTYHVRIRQAMRENPLPDIHDVGFTLSEWSPQ